MAQPVESDTLASLELDLRPLLVSCAKAMDRATLEELANADAEVAAMLEEEAAMMEDVESDDDGVELLAGLGVDQPSQHGPPKLTRTQMRRERKKRQHATKGLPTSGSAIEQMSQNAQAKRRGIIRKLKAVWTEHHPDWPFPDVFKQGAPESGLWTYAKYCRAFDDEVAKAAAAPSGSSSGSKPVVVVPGERMTKDEELSLIHI